MCCTYIAIILLFWDIALKLHTTTLYCRTNRETWKSSFNSFCVHILQSPLLGFSLTAGDSTGTALPPGICQNSWYRSVTIIIVIQFIVNVLALSMTDGNSAFVHGSYRVHGEEFMWNNNTQILVRGHSVIVKYTRKQYNIIYNLIHTCRLVLHFSDSHWIRCETE